MSDEADESGVRRRRRARGRPWNTRRPLDVPTDPSLGRLEGPTLDAVKKLPPTERLAVTLAAQGFTPAEIATMLGYSAETVYQQLYRGRKRVREALKAKGNGAAILTLLIPHRLRALAERIARLGDGAQSAAAAALAPLVACTFMMHGAVASAPTLSDPWSGKPSAGAAQDLTLALASTRTGDAAVRNSASPAGTSYPTRSATAPAAAGHQLLPPLLPNETPEDTDVTAVTASPHYAQDHTVVALGLGHACNCPVLLRSTDGGASWQTTIVAVAGAQVMLPPNYPTDPRIFIGQIPGTARSNWMASSWGQPFQPLTLPPGWLAMAGSRLLSASSTAVWSLDQGVLTPVVTYQGLGTAALASTAGAAYVLAPAHAATLGGVVTTGPTLMACTQSGCELVGSVPLPDVGLLAASGSTVVAASDGRVVVSHDSGSTFQDVTPPGMTAATVALSASPGALWSVAQGTSATSVLHRDTSGWHAAVVDGAKLLAALSDQHVIALLGNGGLLCSADGGASWAVRCPAAAAP